MDPVFKFPASPGTPLFPVSPERANRQHLPQSPSLPSNLIDPFTSHHVKAASDVQGKVAQFNNLGKEASQRRKDNEAALQRAVLGREEAESETRRVKEESSVLRKENEEGRRRERRVGERLETLMVMTSSFLLGKSQLTEPDRRNCNGQRRPMHIPRLCTKKKFAEQEKRLLSHRVRS